MSGFILISRTILDSDVFASQKLLKIWIWCLCKANFKDKTIPFKVGKGERLVKVKRGSFIFGRHKAEEELFIDGSTIYKSIQKMQEMEMIKIESNNQYSIISICNYDTYQDAGKYKEVPSNNQVTTNEQPSNSEVTANEQPSNTTKNDNKVNKVNKVNNNQKGIVFPFESEYFLQQWELWKDYKKKEYNFKYKSPQSEQAALSSLNNLAESEENTAIQIIHQSLSKGWKGFFKLENDKNGKSNSNSMQEYANRIQEKYQGLDL